MDCPFATFIATHIVYLIMLRQSRSIHEIHFG